MKYVKPSLINPSLGGITFYRRLCPFSQIYFLRYNFPDSSLCPDIVSYRNGTHDISNSGNIIFVRSSITFHCETGPAVSSYYSREK